MALPIFFTDNLLSNSIVLDEDSSKHIIGVLRMERGEQLRLTDGKGNCVTGIIEDDHRKRCAVRVLERNSEPPIVPQVSIAISLLKNAVRFEWFLEKATELGVAEIIPMICARTEKEKFRSDRFLTILTSAMIQSQQLWRPILHAPSSMEKVLEQHAEEKYIAHCGEGEKLSLPAQLKPGSKSRLILIGPEGDFTAAEIEAALQKGFLPTSLGQTRLRTETAGMTAAVLLMQGNELL